MSGGAVDGVRFLGRNGPFEVRASSVILATGGFEWNEAMVRAFTRGPLTHPVSIKTNTGDGLKMAMRVGAMLGNMREAWWMPVIEVPDVDGAVSEGLYAAGNVMASPMGMPA